MLGLQEAFNRVHQSVQHGGRVSVATVYGLLQRCMNERNLLLGKGVLSLIIMPCGYESNAFLAAHSIRMFALCGSLVEANQVFQQVKQPNVFTWNAIIWAHVNCGNSDKAMVLYHQLKASGLILDSHIFVAVLKGCSNSLSLFIVYAHLVESGLEMNIHVCTTLCDMFSSFDKFDEALSVFNMLPEKGITSCNAMIKGYTHLGLSNEGLQIFKQMNIEGTQQNHVTFVCILKTCSDSGQLGQGKIFHCQILTQGFNENLILRNALINMYSNCVSVDSAYRVFMSSEQKDVTTWNAMISGYVQHGHKEEALHLFQLMHCVGMDPNEITFTCVIKACLFHLMLGKAVHGLIIENGLEGNMYIASTLINMYANCDNVNDGLSVFSTILEPNLVVWSAIIACYAQNECSEWALDAFLEMQQQGLEPNQVVFSSILKACSDLALLDLGKLIHIKIIESGCKFNAFIASALIDMYTKSNSSQEEALSVFNGFSDSNNIVTWSAMIAGHAQQGQNVEALRLYNNMQDDGVEPNEITFLTLLNLCSSMTDIAQGMLTHVHIVEAGHECDTPVSNSLVDMYANCGNLRDAHKVLEGSYEQNVVTWNALLAGCAKHSDYKTALKCLDAMKLRNLQPNDVTFVSVLSLCNHMGLIYEGHRHFRMIEEFDILPTYEHYTCIIDLFGRAGFFNKAEDILNTMPFLPTIVALVSLLSHCKTYGNAKLATYCYDNLISMDTGIVLNTLEMLTFDGFECGDILEDFQTMCKEQNLAYRG